RTTRIERTGPSSIGVVRGSRTRLIPAERATRCTSSRCSGASARRWWVGGGSPEQRFSLRLPYLSAMGLGREFRLPKDARPTRYELSFDLDLQGWTFTARETIAIDLGAPRRELYLHSVDLAVRSVRIRAGGRELA